MVRVVHAVIVVQVEFSLATGGYDLVCVAIDGEELTKIIARHPALAIPLFGVDPKVDPRVRFEIFKERILSPPGAVFTGVDQPILVVDLD